MVDNPKNLTDIDLLVELSTSSRDNLYQEFVSRYYDDVQKECLLICKKRNLDKHIGIQIAHETFEKVKKTKSFDKEKLSQRSPRKAILGWLYRILSCLFYDFHKSSKKSDEPIEFYLDEIGSDIQRRSGEDLLSNKEIAVKIFKKLNSKEQLVVIKDIEYKRLQKYHDSVVLDILANQLGVKKDSIRKIRQRAKVKIKNEINKINEEK